MLRLRDIAFWRTEFWFPTYRGKPIRCKYAAKCEDVVLKCNDCENNRYEPPKVKEPRRTTWYSRKGYF